MDRHDEVAGDDHVELAQERSARAGPRVDAVRDKQYVASVLLELGTLVKGPGVLDRQWMQAELGCDSM